MGRTRVLPQLFTFCLLLVFALISSGCGSVNGNAAVSPTPTPVLNPSPTPTPTANPSPSPTPAQVSKFIYGAPGFESSGVEAGTIAANGSVSPVAGSPFNEGLGTPNVIQFVGDPRGRFIYVLNVEATAVLTTIGNPGIAGFAVNRQTGALTPVPGNPIVFTERNNNFMAEDGSGRFLFEPNGLGNDASTGFNVYAIDQNTGALTKTSSSSNAPPVGNFTTTSANGQFLFNAGNGLVQAYSISSTGQLTAAGAPVSTSGSAGPMIVSPDSRFLYVTNQNEGTLSVFSIGSGGTLSAVGGSPFTIDVGAETLALTPDGKFLYVAFFADTATSTLETVKGYAVNPTAGTLTAIPGAVVNGVDSLAMDFSGKFIYIGNFSTLFTYSIDPTTGNLTLVSQTTAPSSDDATDLVTIP
ncbi:MAG TPA: beta-propeller fold lactonase family protein [Candidatus Angelobacter sp.]|nr:beta-propeller fold lactonase family protein [Candidatus Angelobacter sp.]